MFYAIVTSDNDFFRECYGTLILYGTLWNLLMCLMEGNNYALDVPSSLHLGQPTFADRSLLSVARGRRGYARLITKSICSGLGVINASWQCTISTVNVKRGLVNGYRVRLRSRRLITAVA